MKKNKGIVAHNHCIEGMSLLFHQYWTIELLEDVKTHLSKSVEYMEGHLKHTKCACGDTVHDLKFYKEVLREVNRAISEKDWFVVPWVQDKLHSYMQEKKGQHNCITRLLHNEQKWVLDDIF